MSSTRRPSPTPTPANRAAFPSRDTQLIESPYVWLREKAEADRQRVGGVLPSHLWYIHGHLYDLSNFDHPGGATFLELTRGTDCTDEFEVHHLDDAKARAVLAKYRCDDSGGTNTDGVAAPRYVWPHDGFYKTLQRRIHATLGKEHGPTVEMRLTCCAILLLFVLSFVGMCAWRSYTLAVFAAFMLHGLMGIGHNFFHQPDAGNWWMYAFDLSLFSSHEWRISHAISHHLYPNTEIDTEVSSFEPFLFMLSNKRRNNRFLVIIAFHVVCALAAPLSIVRRFVAVVLLRREPARWEYVLPLLQLAVCVWWCGARDGLLLFSTLHLVASWLLTSISFAVHRTESLWTEGDPDVAQGDFARHILASSADHSVDVSLFTSLVLFAGLNVHVLHHLCCTVDMSRTRQLRPVLERTCEEFGVKYRTFDFWPQWASMFRRHDLFVPFFRGDVHDGRQSVAAKPQPETTKKQR